MSKAEEVSEFTFQVADIKFSKEGFHIVRTGRGESVSGKFAARLGHCYKAEGTWEQHPTYGPQFKLDSAVSIQMKTPDALGRFLTLQLRGKGVGESVIGSLVEACKADNLDMEELLDRNQRDVLIECVGKRNEKKVDILLDIWPKIKPAADLISPLLGYGLSEAQAEAALALWGKSAVERVEEDPYELILRIDGIAFLAADKIAMKVGRVRKTDPVRLRAAFAFGMRDATTNGDIGVRRKTLIDRTMPLVNESVLEGGKRKLAAGIPPVVSAELLAQTLNEMIAGEAVDSDGEKCGFSSELLEYADEKGEMVVWFKPLVVAEETIARRLAAFRANPRPDLVGLIDVTAAKLGIKELAPEQRAGIEMVLLNPVSIITGGPGVGKSFILKLMLTLFDLAKQKGVLTAPTGKAAKRITESTGRMAQTQHSTIGWQGGTRCAFDETCPMPSQYLVIDESSMDDTELLAATLAAASNDCRIIILGDVDQLASVGPGQCLRDMIRSGVIPCTRLIKGFRFSGGIATAARAVNAGLVPETSDDGQFVFVDTENPTESLMATMKQFLEEGINPDDIQVLSPTHKGDAGCMALNRAIQELVNPAPEHGTNQRLKRDSGDIRVNDRVIQGKNDKEIGLVNGDVGWLVGMDSDSGRLELMLPDKDKPVFMMPAQSNNLKLAYTITVHKSQGAEAKYIFLALDSAAAFMLRRNLIYTGITRGSVKVVLFAPLRVLTLGVRKGEPAEGSRRTSLVPKLLKAFEGRARKVTAPAPKFDPVAEAMSMNFSDSDI
jgi:exodeoxyribonuclease V alpha subunit